MTITARVYDPADRERWDTIVAGSRVRHFMFERDYMEYHADRFAEASLLVYDGGRPLAAFPASWHNEQVISHGGLTFGGLLAGPELTTARALHALEAIREALREQGARELVYKPVPHIYHVGPAEEELYALSVHGAELERRDVSAAVMAGVVPRPSSERRRALARSRAHGVRVAADRAIEPFMALVAEVLHERHDTTPVHTPEEMRRLAERFPDGVRLFTARAGEELIGGVLVYETPAVAHAQYIASSARGRQIGGTDAVFAHLIAERYADRWFDFGVSNERDGTLNLGLMRNKEGFGARAVVYDRYRLAL